MGNDVFNAQSPMGMYFNSNAQGLLQNFLINSLLGNPLGPDEYYKQFTGNIGYESPGGYGLDLGYNQPNPIPGQGNLNWNLTGKIPFDI